MEKKTNPTNRKSAGSPADRVDPESGPAPEETSGTARPDSGRDEAASAPDPDTQPLETDHAQATEETPATGVEDAESVSGEDVHDPVAAPTGSSVEGNGTPAAEHRESDMIDEGGRMSGDAPLAETGDAGEAADMQDRAHDAAASQEVARPQDVIPEPATPPARSGQGFFTLVLGGVLAAVIGFAAARFVVPDGWPVGPAPRAVEDLSAAVDRQAERIATLEARPAAGSDDVTGLSATVGEIGARTDARIADLSADLDVRLAALESGLAEAGASAETAQAGIERLAARIDALERQPADSGEASAVAIETFQRDVAELRALLEEERARNAGAEAAAAARADAVESEARALAQAAARDAALGQIMVALDTGGGFDGAIGRLDDTGVPVPDGLRAHSGGVETLASLQDSFAEPARAALAASGEAAAGDSTTERVGAFLRAQFGVRSLSPRDGSDADAVLSRAEAALRQGDLDGALAEFEALPDAGRDAMAEWIVRAEARAAAVAAADALASE